MNAPVSYPKPIAARWLWPNIHAAYKRGDDTKTIASDLKISEAAVANALHKIKEEARA